MTTVFLVRHGRSTANTAGVLAGWTPGVHLDEVGRAQAVKAGERLAAIKLTTIVSSPLERTLQTAEAILDLQRGSTEIAVDARVGECRYGDWTGRKISQLTHKPLWQVVQRQPSSAHFPGADGESIAMMQARSIDAIRDWNARLGRRASYAVVSHGDVIKAILADALGMHLDMFQRIAVDPGSISVVHYSDATVMVTRLNDSGSDLSGYAGARKAAAPVIGGGAGHLDGVATKPRRGR